ncbi:MAG: ABC transporter substrate-binding protein [Muribaculaceae bacterium]|nr:ABC transporter substrate-binding protein [Muribaculaceae bacterium]
MKNNLFFLIELLCSSMLLVLTGCNDSGDTCPIGSTERYTLAVIMPRSNDAEWRRTVEWSLENIAKSQQGLGERIGIDIEWYDEDAPDMEESLKKILKDDRIKAVIGPKSSSKASIAAEIMCKTDKPLILPIATSTELQREYAATGNIWNMVQSDMTQCEILMTQAKLTGNRSVCLLASSDDYGRSYSDWFAYQAVELHLEVGDVYSYSNEQELRNAIGYIYKSSGNTSKSLIFAPSNCTDLLTFDDELKKLREANAKFLFPDILCTDVVNSSEVKNHPLSMSYEGISPSANPGSGFVTAYHEKFGVEPINGEAHLYDAVSFISYGLMMGDNNSLNQNLHLLAANDKGIEHSWLPDDMAYTFSIIKNGAIPNLAGVTGDWSFDKKYGTTVLNTIYSHWILQDNRFTTIEYLSTDGQGRTTSTLQAWDSQANVFQEFSSTQSEPEYGELHENWAVVISTSDTWANYRHQADALSMYQLLKRHGYDDDHIILIMEDNIAYDSHNIYPGIVRTSTDGDNLYVDVKVDYKLSELDLNKFYDIMTGDSSEGLSSVLPSTKNDNVIVFWTGHGAQSRLVWGNSEEIWSWQIRDMVAAMSNKKKYRKLMFVMDACYSGSIGEACTGIPGVLFITAANAYEPSKADMRDPEMGIWLSNGFTRVFQETIDANPSISLREMYYTLARHTVGSHATVYNAENYGNLYHTSMDEFLR